MTEKKSFWSELQRRLVVRAAIGHIVFFWLLAQVADVVLPYLGVVDEPVRWAIIAGVALFPVTLIIAWFFEHPWRRLTRSRVFIDVVIIAGIAVLATAWVVRNLPEVVHARTSIVVLPFEYNEEDPRGQSLSRALALEINSLLTKSRSIDVVGYESANSSLLDGLDIPGILNTLGVQHVLSGVITSAEASMDVSVRLYDENGEEVWTAQIEEDLDNLFGVQEQIASQVQARLGETEAGVPVAEVAAERCPMPTDPAALERYYTARHYVESRTESDQSRQELREARAIYEGLIEEYPDFAQAYSGLAWTMEFQVTYDPRNFNREEVRPKSAELGRQAYQICNRLGEALVLFDNEADHPNPWINEEQNLALWMEMQPDSPEARQQYIFHLRQVGRLVEALELAEETYRLNPLSVRSMKMLSRAYMGENMWDEAIDLENRSFEFGSTSPPFAAMSSKLFGCRNDVDCFIENLPPPFNQASERMREVYSPPETPEQARAKRDLAIEMMTQFETGALNFFNATACNYEHLTDLYPPMWDAAQEIQMFWFWPNAWRPECGNIWESEGFPRIVEEAGLVEYWNAKEWADACEPKGEGFACSEAIWRKSRAAAGLPLTVGG
jgi:TolB-like protein